MNLFLKNSLKRCYFQARLTLLSDFPYLMFFHYSIMLLKNKTKQNKDEYETTNLFHLLLPVNDLLSDSRDTQPSTAVIKIIEEKIHVSHAKMIPGSIPGSFHYSWRFHGNVDWRHAVTARKRKMEKFIAANILFFFQNEISGGGEVTIECIGKYAELRRVKSSWNITDIFQLTEPHTFIGCFLYSFLLNTAFTFRAIIIYEGKI